MAKKATGLAAFTRQKTTPYLDDVNEEIAPAQRQGLGNNRKRKRGGGDIVALTVKVRRSEWQRLRQLADAEGTTIQAMAETGFTAVFSEHGLPPIEPYLR